MYECSKAKNKNWFYLFIFFQHPHPTLPPHPLLPHSPNPKSFSSCLCLALRGNGLKIEVFPMHVPELFPSVSNPRSPSPPALSSTHTLSIHLQSSVSQIHSTQSFKLDACPHRQGLLLLICTHTDTHTRTNIFIYININNIYSVCQFVSCSSPDP